MKNVLGPSQFAKDSLSSMLRFYENSKETGVQEDRSCRSSGVQEFRSSGEPSSLFKRDSLFKRKIPRRRVQLTALIPRFEADEQSSRVLKAGVSFCNS